MEGEWEQLAVEHGTAHLRTYCTYVHTHVHNTSDYPIAMDRSRGREKRLEQLAVEHRMTH